VPHNKPVQGSTTPVAWTKIYCLDKLLYAIMLEWVSAFSSQFRVCSFHTSCPHVSTGQLKCDVTRSETRFRLSAKRTSPFKSAGGGASVQSTTGSRGVCISCSNAGYTMFRGSVKSTGYPLLSPFSPSLPLPCVTVCHHISTGLYVCKML